jgi:hypothetical protein
MSSVDAPTASAPQPPVSLPAAQSGTHSKTELLTILNIPLQLVRDPGNPDRSESGLRLNYRKYQACINAIQTLASMVTAGKWSGRRPSETELVELFASKSMWHSHFKKLFSRVPQYPQMQKWLKGEEDAPDDYDIWGVEKTNYTFKDLSTWLEEKERKGKGKAAKEKKGKTKREEKKRKVKDDKGKDGDDTERDGSGDTGRDGKGKKGEKGSKKHNTRSSGGK